MAFKELFIQWGNDSVVRNDGNEDYVLYSGELFAFDTVLRSVSSTEVFQNVYLTPVQDTPPSDYSRDITELLVQYVNGASVFRYFHDGAGGLNIEEQVLTLTPFVTGSTCFGGSNASINLAVAGLPGPFTFLWEDGPVTQNRGPMRAGTYRVAVTDGPTGAVARAVVVVGSNPELVVLIEKAGASVKLNVSGGTAPYTYLWSDGITTRDRAGLATGAYSCRITDALGCSKEIQVAVNTDQFYWSRNPITLPLDAGTAYRLDPTTKPNLTFLCEVMIEKEYLSGNFELVGGVLEQPADRDGRTVFEVQALLDTFLRHHVPPVGSKALTRADPMFRRFYLKHAESFGEPPVRAATAELLQNYVVLGGLDFYNYRSRTFFDSYQGNVMPFLTWEPPVKPALFDQPEYLYYLVTKSTGGFFFKARVQYTDGTTETLTISAQFNVQLHEVYCQSVGYQALGLAAIAGTRRVGYWEVFVVGPDEAQLSEVRRYVLDEQHYPKRRYLLFATSLGGMATYAATGEAAQLDVEISGEQAARTLTPDYDPLQGDTEVQTRVMRDVIKIAGGKRDRAQMLASKDFLLSRRVLLLDRGRWVAGHIKAKNASILDESRGVLTQDFDFYPPAEQLYTPHLGQEQVRYDGPLGPGLTLTA